MHIAPAGERDLPVIAAVHRLAFGRDDEATLVATLLRDPTAQSCLSLLAFEAGRPIGHALFTPLSLRGASTPLACSLLAPLAVVPGAQRRGAGRALVDHAAGELIARGVGLVFVLGDPAYYTRLGFEPAAPHGLHAPYPIEPAEAWMVRPLERSLLGTVRGTLDCAAELARPELWRE